MLGTIELVRLLANSSRLMQAHWRHRLPYGGLPGPIPIVAAGGIMDGWG
jgi:hypothetical protein